MNLNRVLAKAMKQLAESSTKNRPVSQHAEAVLSCAFPSSYRRADAHNTLWYNHCFEQAWRKAEYPILQCLVPVLPNTIPVWEVLCVHLPFLLDRHCLLSVQHQPTIKMKRG